MFERFTAGKVKAHVRTSSKGKKFHVREFSREEEFNIQGLVNSGLKRAAAIKYLKYDKERFTPVSEEQAARGTLVEQLLNEATKSFNAIPGRGKQGRKKVSRLYLR